jgi:hypothetical protein
LRTVEQVWRYAQGGPEDRSDRVSGGFSSTDYAQEKVFYLLMFSCVMHKSTGATGLTDLLFKKNKIRIGS